MKTYKLTIEYAGTRYRGWQEQPQERTVAGEIRNASGEILGRDVDLGAAGRTDAGVHALAQVAHLRTSRAPRRLAEELNARLPADIHVLAAETAPPNFHARHDAVLRSYIYQVSRRRNAFLKPFVWWVREPLDAGLMHEAAGLLAGRHDFTAFSEPDPQQKSSKVEVKEAVLAECGDLLVFRVVASHFLWKMVRRLTGALVQVGRGDMTVDSFHDRLATGRGSVAEWTAPPSGLFLERVLYDTRESLPPPAPAVTLAGGTPCGS